MDRDRERETIAEDIDGAITFWVFLLSFLLGIAALVLYQSGQPEAGIALGVVSFIGASIPTVGYSWWRKRRIKREQSRQ